MKSIRLEYVLLICWILLAMWSYHNCYDVTVWRAEMTPIIAIVVGIVLISRSHRFSPLSYCMMAVLLYMHTIGAHYTFERVPFDRFTDFFGFERNHYDRIAHFSVGFYAYPIMEWLLAKNKVSSVWVAFCFAVCVILSVAAVYEIIERLFAVAHDPEAGAAFLGSQGDHRDAQKDMLADGLGGIVAGLVYILSYKK